MSGGEIRVDPDGLKGFAADVRSDTTKGFEPEALAARARLDQQMPFGAANASAAVLEAKQRYVEALNVAMDNLKAYADMAVILASAAETVATEFSGADAQSAQDLTRVEQLLSDAAGAVAARNIGALHVDLGEYR